MTFSSTHSFTNYKGMHEVWRHNADLPFHRLKMSLMRLYRLAYVSGLHGHPPYLLRFLWPLCRQASEGLVHVRHCPRYYSINISKKRPVVSINVFSCFIQVWCWLSCRGKYLVFDQLFFCNPHVLSNENRLRGKGNGYLAHDSALMTLEGEYQQIWLIIILILMIVILQLSQTTCN